MKAFCQRIENVDKPVDFIKSQLERGAIDKDQLLKMIADDHNLLDYMHVAQCVDEGLFTENDLSAVGIDEQFANMLWDRQVFPTWVSSRPKTSLPVPARCISGASRHRGRHVPSAPSSGQPG